jgi:hypothetical protein
MRRGNVIALLIMFILLVPVIAGAADITNSAFKQEGQQTLKAKFALCNEFLDVKWVDKAKMTGLLATDIYRDGKVEKRFLIVRLEKPGTKAYTFRGNGVFYEISGQEYEDPSFAKFLAGANYSFSHQNVFMNVSKGKKSERYPQEPLPFEAFVAHKNVFPDRSFSNFTKTVCLAYPDAARVFVVETKKPFMNSPMDEQAKKSFESVSKYASKRCETLNDKTSGCYLHNLRDSYALDLNGDGKEDYIFVIRGKQGEKETVKRYMLISGGDEGYTTNDRTGCLGYGRFFYGYSDGKSFRLGTCAK